MNFKKAALLFAVFLSFNALAEGDGDFLKLPEVDVIPEKSEGLSVGDAIILRFYPQVDGAKDLDVPPDSSSLSDLGWKISQLPDGTFKLVPLKAGDLLLPSMIVKNTQGQSVSRTLSKKFTIASAISPTDPKAKIPEDMRPPAGLPFPILVVSLLVFLILVALSLLGYFLYQKFKAKPVLVEKSEPVIPKEPEEEVALRALNQVKTATWRDASSVKYYSFRVSEILKVYLGDRYGFLASESTSEEVLTVLEKDKKISSNEIDQIEKLFAQLDRIKFTDIEETEEVGKQLVEDARTYVIATKRGPNEIR